MATQVQNKIKQLNKNQSEGILEQTKSARSMNKKKIIQIRPPSSQSRENNRNKLKQNISNLKIETSSTNVEAINIQNLPLQTDRKFEKQP